MFEDVQYAPNRMEPRRNQTQPPYPEDCDECVFLLRACERIGAAKFGSEWTGRERSTVLPDLLPDAIDPRYLPSYDYFNPTDPGATPAQWLDPPGRAILLRANSLLIRHRADLHRPVGVPGIAAMFDMRITTFTYSEWQAAQQAAKFDRDLAQAAIVRLQDVNALIKKYCLNGELEAQLRAVRGGEYSVILPRSVWRTEDLKTRFYTYKMHPSLPFRPNVEFDDRELQWIFLTRASLERVDRTLQRAHSDAGSSPSQGGEATAAMPYESEFMQCMRRTVEALGITAENQPKKTLVELEIPKHWQGQEKLSPSNIKAMASFIRSVESRDSAKSAKRRGAPKG